MTKRKNTVSITLTPHVANQLAVAAEIGLLHLNGAAVEPGEVREAAKRLRQAASEGYGNLADEVPPS